MSNFLVGNTNYAPVWTDLGTGGGVSYTLPSSGTAVSTLVVVGGSIQEPGVDYSISGTSLSMTSSITAGIGVLACQLYALGTVNVPVDNSVTAAKTDLTLAEGSLIYGTGADAWTLLAKGAANQQLAMNAGATAPEWVTVAGGGWEFVSLTSASGASDVKYETLSGNYDYRVQFRNLVMSDNAKTTLVFGTGGTPTYASAYYQYQLLRASQSSVSSAGNDGSGQAAIDLDWTMHTEARSGYVEIYDLADSSTYTSCVGVTIGQTGTSGVECNDCFTGRLETTQADNAIKFDPSSGTFTGGFALFRRPNA